MQLRVGRVSMLDQISDLESLGGREGSLYCVEGS